MLSRSLYTHHFKYHRKPRRASAGRQATRCKRVWLGLHTHTCSAETFRKHFGEQLWFQLSGPVHCARISPPSSSLAAATECSDRQWHISKASPRPFFCAGCCCPTAVSSACLYSLAWHTNLLEMGWGWRQLLEISVAPWTWSPACALNVQNKSRRNSSVVVNAPSFLIL